MAEYPPGDTLAFNAIVKYNLFGDSFPDLTDKTPSFRIPTFQLIPGFETVCLLIIALSYDDPEDWSSFYFENKPLRSGKGFARTQTVDVSEAFARFLGYHLRYELRDITDPDPLHLLTHPAIDALSDRSETLLENLVLIHPPSALWHQSVLTSSEALQHILFLLFRANDFNDHSSVLFATDGITFDRGILRPVVRVPAASSVGRLGKGGKGHWGVLKQFGSGENCPCLAVTWFICSSKGRMSLCILRSGRLIQLADGFQDWFQLTEEGCDFFKANELRLYVVAYSLAQLPRDTLDIDRANQPRKWRPATDARLVPVVAAQAENPPQNLIQRMCAALSSPAFFGSISNFKPPVCDTLAALVSFEFTGNAFFDKAMRADAEIAIAIRAWRSFSVFCSVFVDFITACTSVRQDAITSLLPQLFRVLPIQTPSVVAGVVQVLGQLVKQLSSGSAQEIAARRDPILEMLAIAVDASSLEALQLPWPRDKVEAWKRTDPSTKLAKELTNEPRTPRHTIRELRKLIESNPGLSVPIGQAKYQVLPRFAEAQGGVPSASVRAKTVTQFMCKGLRHPAFLAEKSGFTEEVSKLLEQAVEAGLTRTALRKTTFVDENLRELVLDAEVVWSSFKVFCGTFVDFAGYWGAPDSDGFERSLIRVFSSLPTRTPALFSKVITLFCNFFLKLAKTPHGGVIGRLLVGAADDKCCQRLGQLLGRRITKETIEWVQPTAELRSPKWLAKRLQKVGVAIRELDSPMARPLQGIYRPASAYSAPDVSPPSCKTIVGLVRNALSDPTLFAIKSGFSPEVGFALAVLVKSRLPVNPALIEWCRVVLEPREREFEQSVSETKHAWSSFVVFSRLFVDFLATWAHPTRIGLVPLFRQILAVLPIRTPKLFAGVVGLVRQIAAVDPEAAALFAAIDAPPEDLERILMRPVAGGCAGRNRIVRDLQYWESIVDAVLPVESVTVSEAYRQFWERWPSRRPTATVDFICRSLRDPAFFVSECGGDGHVQFVFAMIVNVGVEDSAEFIETYRERAVAGVRQADFKQQLLEVERAWSSFTVFCAQLVDQLKLWDRPASPEFGTGLARLFGVLPFKTRPLLTGVVHLLVKFAQKLSDAGPSVANQRDRLLELLAIAIRGEDLDKFPLPCTDSQREAWARNPPQHYFMGRAPGGPIAVRRMIREIRELAKVIPALSLALPTSKSDEFQATPKCTEYWQAIKQTAAVRV